MADDRSCGSCSECCRILEIKETAKAPMVWCEHAKASCGGSGCAIYEARPKICREYACVWRDPGPLAELLPDSARPNEIGMLLQVVIVGFKEHAIDAIIQTDEPTPEQLAIVQAIAEKTGVVTLITATGPHFIIAQGALANAGNRRALRLHGAARVASTTPGATP